MILPISSVAPGSAEMAPGAAYFLVMTRCRRLLQLPGLVDEILMDGAGVGRGPVRRQSAPFPWHVGASEHDGIEERMRPGLHPPQVREIAAAHDMTSGTEAIVEHLAGGDLPGIGGRTALRKRRVGAQRGAAAAVRPLSGR